MHIFLMIVHVVGGLFRGIWIGLNDLNGPGIYMAEILRKFCCAPTI